MSTRDLQAPVDSSDRALRRKAALVTARAFVLGPAALLFAVVMGSLAGVVDMFTGVGGLSGFLLVVVTAAAVAIIVFAVVTFGIVYWLGGKSSTRLYVLDREGVFASVLVVPGQHRNATVGDVTACYFAAHPRRAGAGQVLGSAMLAAETAAGNTIHVVAFRALAKLYAAHGFVHVPGGSGMPGWSRLVYRPSPVDQRAA